MSQYTRDNDFKHIFQPAMLNMPGKIVHIPFNDEFTFKVTN